MIWKILGIEETKDKKAIKNAYRERLSSINPEEKPDEFKELRSAYEKAIELADQTEKPSEEKNELELWTDELAALYNDLQRRNDTAAWNDLLSRDICMALDSRQDAEDALLRFMMDHFRVSHKVIVFLNEKLGFTDHIDELREKFPAEFIEYVLLNGIRYDDAFPLELFTPGKDGAAADYYIANYFKASRTNPDEASSLYEELENSSEKHPYGDALLLKYKPGTAAEDAVKGIEALYEKYPEDNHIAVDLMYVYKQAGQSEKIGKIAEECLARNPKHVPARQYQAEALAASGKYREAIDILNRLMQDLTGDQRSITELDEVRQKWNESLMEQLKTKLEENPDDSQSLYDLIFCYLQNDRTEEADELAKKLPEEKPDAFAYYNAKSAIASELGRLDEALENTKKLLVAVDNLKPDGTTLTDERIGRRTEVVGRISALLCDLGRKEEAVEMAEESVKNNPDIPSMFNLINIHIEMDNFSRVGELSDMVLAKDPSNPTGFFYKAVANFKLNRDNIAFDAINDALERDGSNLQYYLLKLRILVRNHADDAARELIDFLEQNGITDNPTVDYCSINMFANQHDTGAELTKEDYDAILEKAAALSGKLLENDEANPDWAAHFYYLYALITADRQDFDQKYPVGPIIEILDKGLSKDPGFYSCLSYKAWLLKKDGKTEDAEKIYRSLEQRPEHNFSVEENIAGICYDDLLNRAEEALGYYKQLIEREPENADWYFYAGMCLNRMENPVEAEECFRKEQQYDPEGIDGYFRMAYVLMKLGRLEEAVTQARIAVEMAKKRDGNTVRFWTPLIHSLRMLGNFEEAREAAEVCGLYNKDWNAKGKVVDILLQAGQYDEAQNYLDEWRKSMNKHVNTDWGNAQTKVYMLQNKLKKLSFELWNYKDHIDESDQADARQLIAASKGDFKEYGKTAEKAYNDSIEKQGKKTYITGNYAMNLFIVGKTEEAKRIAAETLEETEKELVQASGNRKVSLCRKFRMLSILGLTEEAEKACEEAERMYPCEFCDYGECKDLYIFKCEAEMVKGNYQKALEMAAIGKTKWPDEYDFIELEYILDYMSKGKRK